MARCTWIRRARSCPGDPLGRLSREVGYGTTGSVEHALQGGALRLQVDAGKRAGLVGLWLASGLASPSGTPQQQLWTAAPDHGARESWIRAARRRLDAEP